MTIDKEKLKRSYSLLSSMLEIGNFSSSQALGFFYDAATIIDDQG
jgi:hypothetical protein